MTELQINNIKKYLFPLILLFVAIAFVLFKNYSSNKPSPIPAQQTGYEARVNISVDFGNKTAKQSELVIDSDDTAYTVLKRITEKEEVKLETVQYDFGVFVKKIGEFESTAKKSWIYYVNGESGSIAADQYKLKNGDKVEWKYETPKL